MGINIGDTVRFLREVGGGKVTGFRKGGLVMVEDSDGFEIPMLESDLVVIPDVNRKSIAHQKQENNTIGKSSNSTNQSNTTDIIAQETENIKERVAKLEQTIAKLARKIEELEAANTLRQHAKPLQQTSEKEGYENRLKKSDIVEIDLHAHALLDSIEGLSATDIKQYQIKTFKETMERFRKDIGRQIVFIHGNGDGVLRQAILTELKYNYKHCKYQDASFQNYGFGATMVTIGRK